MSDITVKFPRLNQFWNDSGVLGLYRCIIGKIHQEPQRGVAYPKTNLDKELQTSTKLEADQLVISGEVEKVQGLLESAYNDRLIKHYYDLSSKKQWEDVASYNFFFDSEEGKFKSFPKRKARGIAAFIADIASRPAGGQVKWEDKTPGKLPDDYAHLQDRLDDFLKEKGLKPGPGAGMLIDEPNRVRPKVSIQVQEPNRKSTRKTSPCFLCGNTSSEMEKMNQTIFPFMTGVSGVLSFYSGATHMTRGATQVCWRCSFVGKFVPVNGFYIQTGNRMHMFFPFAPNLCKMNDVYNRLSKKITEWEPNFYRNIAHQLGGYFTHPSEMAFAFLHRVYVELTNDDELNEDDFFEDKVFDFAFKNAPLAFFIISTEQKGQIQMPTQVRLYDNLVYLFRLFRHLSEKGGDWKSIARNMLDYTSVKDGNKSLKRNHMLDAVLTKQSILRQAETFAFHVNRSENQYIAPLVEFTTQYETLLKGEHKMEKEALDAAVALGKRIGAAVGSESGKKGDLFSLRKSRKLSDFLNELNRLQFRFNVAIPPAVYEGYLTDANFEEFKGFCLLAGLNTFNASTAPKRETTT